MYLKMLSWNLRLLSSGSSKKPGKSEINSFFSFSNSTVVVTLSLVVFGVEPIIDVYLLDKAFTSVDLPALGNPSINTSGILFLFII